MPFVLATHNGHLSNADALVKRLRLRRQAEVDSEVLFRIFHRARDVHELRRLASLCRGHMSAAFVRLDQPTKAYLLKGDMPLALGYVRPLRTMFYASEPWMLESALEGQQWECLALDPMTLATFDTTELLAFAQQDVAFQTRLYPA